VLLFEFSPLFVEAFRGDGEEFRLRFGAVGVESVSWRFDVVEQAIVSWSMTASHRSCLREFLRGRPPCAVQSVEVVGEFVQDQFIRHAGASARRTSARKPHAAVGRLREVDRIFINEAVLLCSRSDNW